MDTLDVKFEFPESGFRPGIGEEEASAHKEMLERFVDSFGIVAGRDEETYPAKRFEDYVERVLPGADISKGTVPRVWFKALNAIRKDDRVDLKGVKVADKSFDFILNDFSPKMKEALKSFFSSRVWVIASEMVEVRNGVDGILKAGKVTHEKLPSHWVESYTRLIGEMRAMYELYDKLGWALLDLDSIAEDGFVVEKKIADIRSKLFFAFWGETPVSAISGSAAFLQMKFGVGEELGFLEKELRFYVDYARGPIRNMLEAVNRYKAELDAVGKEVEALRKAEEAKERAEEAAKVKAAEEAAKAKEPKEPALAKG